MVFNQQLCGFKTTRMGIRELPLNLHHSDFPNEKPIIFLQCGAPQTLCLLVYKPHEYHSYQLFAYHKPLWNWRYVHQLNAIVNGGLTLDGFLRDSERGHYPPAPSARESPVLTAGIELPIRTPLVADPRLSVSGRPEPCGSRACNVARPKAIPGFVWGDCLFT